MKLLRLKINEKFRSLQAGFEVRFLREWDYDKADEFNPYILAGPNGSGKSNILEALAAIFYHLDCMYLDALPDIFGYDEESNPAGFQSACASPDSFELEYFIQVSSEFKLKYGSKRAHILVSKNLHEQPRWKIINLDDDEADEGFIHIGRTIARQLLPSYVLGYSSGENEILSLPFFKMRFIHYDEYFELFAKEFDYKGSPEGRLVYLDNTYSQAILLANYLVKDPDEEDDSELKPFLNVLGIEAIKSFRIIIRTHTAFKQKDYPEFPDELVQGIEDDLGDRETFIKITSQLDGVIKKLSACATAIYDDIENHTIYLDYWVNDATRKAFKLHFGEPIVLFQVFQSLLILNLYPVKSKLKQDLYHSSSLYVNETVPTLCSDERVMRIKHFNVKKQGIEKYVPLKSLSDGEHQFLHSLGLSLLFNNENALFLLDEPETHFNPAWRAKFVSTLRDCFSNNGNNNVVREMLITTHSPFLISDSETSQVLCFEKDPATQQIKASRPEYKTLGTSINKITMETFDRSETIGDYAQARLNEFKKRFAEGESADLLLEEIEATLGDSVEKILFMKELSQHRDK